MPAGVTIGLPSTAAYVVGRALRSQTPVNGARTPPARVSRSVDVLRSPRAGVLPAQTVPSAGTVIPSASRPLDCTWLATSLGVSTVSEPITVMGCSRSRG